MRRLFIFTFLTLCLVAPPSFATDSDAAIDKLKHLSECRAVLDYYQNFISIAMLVNDRLGDKIKYPALSRLIRDIDQSSSRLSIRQELLVKNHLLDLPSDVIIDIIASSYADGLSELDSRLSSPLFRETALDRSKFLEEFAITYKKCTSFLYDN